MEVKISEKGIYKIISSNEGLSSVQIYDILEASLDSNENIFAKFSATTGYFVWELPGDGWNKLSNANDAQKTEVYAIIAQKRKIIEPKLRNTSIKPLDALFKVPSEDYIFYRINKENCIEVKLVGWDYKFPAKGPEESASIKFMPPSQKQDVKLSIMEAGNKLPNYKLWMKIQTGKFADKETDASGEFHMKLPVGYECCILSKDNEHDFSFVVVKDKYEYVFDITKPLTVKVSVNKDDAPANNCPVRIDYDGNESTIYTSYDGIVEREFVYVKDAVANITIDNQTQTVVVQYPITEVLFDIKTPKAVIDILYRRNGEAVEGEKIVLDVLGKGSVVLITDSNGKATYTIPYGENIDVCVRVNSIEQNKYLERHTEFVIDEKNDITPPSIPDEEEPYEPVIPAPYNIYVKTEKNIIPQGHIVLVQGGEEYKIQLDEDGKCTVGKDLIVPNKIVNATINVQLGVFEDLELEFETDEDDYEIMLKVCNRRPFWPIFFECLAAGGVGLMLFGIYRLFQFFFF